MSELDDNDIRDVASLHRTKVETLEDVLKEFYVFHEHLQTQYSVVRHQAEREHMRLLFAWCITHEARMMKSLKEILADTPEATLGRWFKYGPVIPLSELSSQVNIHAAMGRKDLVEETQRIYEAISLILQPHEDTAVPEDSMQVLGSLRTLEREHAVATHRAALDE